MELDDSTAVVTVLVGGIITSLFASPTDVAVRKRLLKRADYGINQGIWRSCLFERLCSFRVRLPYSAKAPSYVVRKI